MTLDTAACYRVLSSVVSLIGIWWLAFFAFPGLFKDTRSARLVRDRLNCIVTWPILLLFDIGIAWTGEMPWGEARKVSKRAVMKVWNRNARAAFK